MEKDIARFNERITIQKNVVVIDRYHNHKNTWSDYYSCYTYASTYQYDKEESDATTNPEQTINFVIRYSSEVKDIDSTHYRIIFHGAIYNIISVDHMNYQRRTIRVKAKLERGAANGQ